MDTWYRIDQLMDRNWAEPYWMPLLYDPRSPSVANRFEDEMTARGLLDHLRRQGHPVRLVKMTSEVIAESRDSIDYAVTQDNPAQLVDMTAEVIDDGGTP